MHYCNVTLCQRLKCTLTTARWYPALISHCLRPPSRSTSVQRWAFSRRPTAWSHLVQCTAWAHLTQCTRDAIILLAVSRVNEKYTINHGASSMYLRIARESCMKNQISRRFHIRSREKMSRFADDCEPRRARFSLRENSDFRKRNGKYAHPIQGL